MKTCGPFIISNWSNVLHIMTYLTILNIIWGPFPTTLNHSLVIWTIWFYSDSLDHFQQTLTDIIGPLPISLDLSSLSWPFLSIITDHISSCYIFKTIKVFTLDSVKASSSRRAVMTDDWVLWTIFDHFCWVGPLWIALDHLILLRRLRPLSADPYRHNWTLTNLFGPFFPFMTILVNNYCTY